MKHVVVGAMWRDAGMYVRQSLWQYAQLGMLLRARGDHVEFIFVENDSQDDTAYHLNEYGACGHDPVTILHASDGCPYYPSKDIPERWRHLAWVANHVLDEIPADTDVFMWVESDLAWMPEDLLHLIDATDEHPVVAAANHRTNGQWYDIFGTRVKGRRFRPDPPFHPEFTGEPMFVDSTGGCVAMRAHVARETRNQPEDGYVGWMRDIRAKGYPILLDPTIRVVHP